MQGISEDDRSPSVFTENVFGLAEQQGAANRHSLMFYYCSIKKMNVLAKKPEWLIIQIGVAALSCLAFSTNLFLSTLCFIMADCAIRLLNIMSYNLYLYSLYTLIWKYLFKKNYLNSVDDIWPSRIR